MTKNKRRISIICTIVLITVLSFIAYLLYFNCDVWDESDIKYLDFMESLNINDSTDSHLRNMFENVQITSGRKFIKKDSVLYELVDGKHSRVLEKVYCFVVLDSVIYYTKTNTKGLYCYNMTDKTTCRILSKSIDILWFTIYKGDFLCLTQNKLMLFSRNNEGEKVLLEYDEPLPDHIVMLGEYLVFCTDIDVQIIDLERRQKRIMSSYNGLAWSDVKAGEESIYFSFQSFFVLGNYNEEKVSSKWNGLWKISLSDIELGKYSLIKISDVFYEKFYCINEKLYDMQFNVIEG